jgi:predicted esterase
MRAIMILSAVVLGSFALGCSTAESEPELPGAGTGAALAGIGGAPPSSHSAGASGMTASGAGGSSGSVGVSGTGGGGVNGGGTGGGGAAGAGGAAGVGGAGGNAGVGGAGGEAGAGGAGGDAGADGDPVMSSGCGVTPAPESDTYTIDVEGTERTYILRLPDDYDANHPYRLILSYHPLGGTAQSIASGNYFGLWSLANGSTIFAAPQGIGNRWSDSGRTRTTGGEDIDFTRALLDELTSTLCIDESRIFAEGFSMGGSMSYAVACAMGDVVRGVVAHSGGPMSGCVDHDTPVAYFMTHGTQDNVCTYPEYGVPQIEDFASVNGCMPTEMPTPSGSTPACVDFAGCMPGYPARACIFVGGHTPSPSGGWVPTESWQFISQF